MLRAKADVLFKSSGVTNRFVGLSHKFPMYMFVGFCCKGVLGIFVRCLESYQPAK